MMATAVVIGVVVATLTFFITTKGFTYVKDELFGNDSKELLEGEWVYSEYGNPGVKIETPQVLKRIDVATTMPKNTLALMKEIAIELKVNLSFKMEKSELSVQTARSVNVMYCDHKFGFVRHQAKYRHAGFVESLILGRS